MDYQAEEELQKLEEKLGMRAKPLEAETPAVQAVTIGGATEAPTVAPAEASASDIDRQLAELEKRIQGHEKDA